MGSNSFGKVFQVLTWGESHGKAIGVVIDGCPAGLELNDEDINVELERRAPGKTPFVSPRKETDRAEILSGVFEGKTTGAPISIMIPNQDADSSKYEPIRHLLRPGHANFTYLKKYGIFDYRGGGRCSGRETACRVAAGAVAKKLLARENIEIAAFLAEVGGISSLIEEEKTAQLRLRTLQSPIFCPDADAETKIISLLSKTMEEGDSLGGIVEVIATNVPAGLGDPIYDKLESRIAAAMMSLPATKGCEVGSGFESARMKGSQHNDSFVKVDEQIRTKTNHGGGVLGGISTGMPIRARIVFKPTSSIKQEQETLTIDGKPAQFMLPSGSRHDPCVTIRAVPVVEAMMALVLVDAYLSNLSARI